MKNKFAATILSTIFTASILSSCTASNLTSINPNVVATTTASTTKINSEISVKYDSTDEDLSWNSESATSILLSGNTITTKGTGATVKGKNVIVSSAGTYVITGNLTDGQIIVNTQDKGIVRLVLNGANISCSDNAPIYVQNAKKAVILLADKSINSITDGASYTFEKSDSDEPNATLFSKADLSINGNGKLTVNAKYKNGIMSKDELKIMNGNITVNSVGDAIKGKDYVAIKNGTINVTSEGDGIQSSNDEDTSKGFVLISDGKLNITSAQDAIQAETSVLINDGTLQLKSGGGNEKGVKKVNEQPGGMGGRFNKDISSKSPSTESTVATSDNSSTISKKAIKAIKDIIIKGGKVNIDSADDSIHSNNSILISGGTVTATAGDDGIHADAAIDITSGNVNIKKSYEGIESKVITVNNGNLYITASDDGVNISGGNDGSSVNGRSGQNEFATLSNASLNINGGYISVNASGDGLDSNGSINMTAGTVIVNGPTNDGNGPLDYNGDFKMTGGYLVAVGSSGMAQAPSDSSTQYSILANFSSKLTAGTMVHIEGNGKSLLSFVPTKDYQSVLFCSPELQKGSSYDIYYEGSSTGKNKDGLLSGGVYTAGKKFDSFTVSDVVSHVGEVSRGMGSTGMRPNGNPPEGMRPEGNPPEGIPPEGAPPEGISENGNFK